jgi:hypothetical protein
MAPFGAPGLRVDCPRHPPFFGVFTMPDFGVHDADPSVHVPRSVCSRWADLRVHDAAIRAFTIGRFPHPGGAPDSRKRRNVPSQTLASRSVPVRVVENRGRSGEGEPGPPWCVAAAGAGGHEARVDGNLRSYDRRGKEYVVSSTLPRVVGTRSSCAATWKRPFNSSRGVS